MKLNDILKGIDCKVTNAAEREVTGITFDSRQAKEGVVFVAQRGVHVDGHCDGDVEGGLPVSDMAPILGGLCGRRYRVFDGRVAESLGGSPRVAEIARTSACNQFELCALALADGVG